MSETENISKMAAILAKDIFKELTPFSLQFRPFYCFILWQFVNMAQELLHLFGSEGRRLGEMVTNAIRLPGA